MAHSDMTENYYFQSAFTYVNTVTELYVFLLRSEFNLMLKFKIVTLTQFELFDYLCLGQCFYYTIQ